MTSQPARCRHARESARRAPSRPGDPSARRRFYELFYQALEEVGYPLRRHFSRDEYTVILCRVSNRLLREGMS